MRDGRNSISKSKIFGKTTYKVDGKEVPREEYEKMKNKIEMSSGEILDPDARYTFDSRYIGTKNAKPKPDGKCPDGYHWVNTYSRRKHNFLYTKEIVRGHCARDK